MERMEALTNYYTTHNEDARLISKRGMVDILTILLRMGMTWMPWNLYYAFVGTYVSPLYR